MTERPVQPSEREGENRSYRCPVCSHVDGVEPPHAPPFRFTCAHCDTLLEVPTMPDTSERIPVQVVPDDESS